MTRLTALRLLFLASLSVVGWDCLHYYTWPFSLGLGIVLGWLMGCAYLYARSRLTRPRHPDWSGRPDWRL